MKPTIRVATPHDFDRLYELGLATPELRVSATEAFMDHEEFMWSIKNPEGVFLLAEVGSELAGFIYGSAKDAERPMEQKWACIVYVATVSKFRRQGIASQLYDACVSEFKRRGITKLYAWASAESKGGIVSFMESKGFAKGHTYTWMDKNI